MQKSIDAKFIAWPAALLFVAGILLPLLYLVIGTMLVGSKISFDNFSSIFEPAVLKSIISSIIIATSTGLISVVVGCGFAFLFVKTNLPYKNLLRLLLVLPLLLPPYIITVAWTDVWIYIGIPVYISHSLPAVIFILSTVYIPLSTFIIGGSMQNISASIEEAGEMITGYKTVFFRIILPLIRPALFSSFILIFILSVSEFAVPSYLAVDVFTTEIFTQFSAFYNYSAAITHALVLTAICLLLILPEKFYLSNAPFITFGEKSFRWKTNILDNKTKWLLLCVMYILLFVVLPLIMLVVQSITGTGVSFMAIFKQLLPALTDSLLLSATGASLITVLGYAFATISVTFRIKISDFLLLLVFSVPAIATGIALTSFYNTPALNFIYSSSIIVLLAFTARFLFISQKIIANGLMQIPHSYQEAAILMGASSFYAFRKVVLPLVGESLFTSFFLVLIFCVSELTTVIMVYPPGISLLPVRIYTLMANAPQSTVSTMCLIALLFSLFLITLMLGGRNLLFNQQWKKSQ